MDRIVICDGVGTLVHSATLADVSLEGFLHDQDYYHTEDTQNYGEGGVGHYNRDTMTEDRTSAQNLCPEDQTSSAQNLCGDENTADDRDASEQQEEEERCRTPKHKRVGACARAKTFQSMLTLGSPRRPGGRQYTSLQLFRLSSASSSSDSFSDSVPLIDHTDKVIRRATIPGERNSFRRKRKKKAKK